MRLRPRIPDLKSVLKKAGTAVRAAAEKQLVRYAQENRDDFVERIEDQDFDSFHVVFYPESGTNLSPRWLARKAAADADPRTLIATGHYLAKIQVFHKRTPKGGLHVRVGFHPSAKARDLQGKEQTITLNRVALVLEHGSEVAQIPARPAWGPFLRELRKRHPKDANEFADVIGSALKKAVPAFTVERK